MATINIGGRTVEVPDDLDPSKPPQQQPLRSAGGAPHAPNSAPPAQPGDLRAGATRPLPDADAATYNNSPEGRASQRQYHSARAQQAGVGAGYSGAPPVGNNATAGAAAEAEAAARYAQQMGRGAPGAPAAPSPAVPQPTRVQSLRNMASGAASAIGNTLLYGGAAAGGYAAASGLRGVGGGGAPSNTPDAPSPVIGSQLANQIPDSGTGPTPGAQPYNFWTDSETGRNLGNAANALAPLGGIVSTVKNLPKVASVADAALGGLAAGVRTQRENAPPVQTPAEPNLRDPGATAPAQTVQPPNLRDSAANPYADENARKLAEFGAQNPNLGAQNPNLGAQSPTTTNDVTRNGNEYSGTNIAGDITINGMPSGFGLGRGSIISPQNMAAADALAGRDNLRSMGAAQASAAQMPMAQAPIALHSGNSWQARNDLRNLEVAASSIAHQSGRVTNDRGRVINPGVGDNGAREAYQAALKQDLAMRSAQPGLDLETNKSNNSLRSDIFKAQTGADASRYAADQGLRGEIFKAAATERTAARQAQRDAAAAASAERKYTTERRDRALERLDKVFETAATRDGKVDAQQLAAMRNGAQAFLGTAIEAARKRGDTATVQQLESQGLGALAEDPQLMRRYMAALSADRAARGGWMPGENYVGTDNPGGRTVVGVDKGTFVDTVRLSDGTTMNANRLRYRDGGPLSGLNPWAEPTTEFDSIDPKGYLRRPQQ